MPSCWQYQYVPSHAPLKVTNTAVMICVSEKLQQSFAKVFIITMRKVIQETAACTKTYSQTSIRTEEQSPVAGVEKKMPTVVAGSPSLLPVTPSALLLLWSVPPGDALPCLNSQGRATHETSLCLGSGCVSVFSAEAKMLGES